MKFGLQPPVYLTANWGEDGELFEVFIWQGNEGGVDYGNARALGVVISEVLRLGGDPGRLGKKLRGIRDSKPSWEEGQLLLSLPDCVGRFLEAWVKLKTVDGGWSMVNGVDKEKLVSLIYPKAERCQDPGD